jgi:hypothetical protein
MRPAAPSNHTIDSIFMIIMIYNEFCFGTFDFEIAKLFMKALCKIFSALSEDVTHDLKIMSLTRCQLLH